MYPRKYTSYPSEDTITGFSILIPTWNNLPYLKLCIESILTHSGLKHQIIVAINEGSDGSLEYVLENRIDHVHFEKNSGVCYAVNAARSLARSKYLMYINDDMYVLPGWDRLILDKILQLSTPFFMLSATMIEPHHTGNPCVIVKDFGSSPDTFQKELLIKYASRTSMEDWQGSTWPPFVVHRNVWDLVGGFGIEFTPGFYSDPDFSMKLKKCGVQHFIGLGRALVYHFGTKSTKRVKKNAGKDLFLLKWGITSSDFYKYILRIGSQGDAQNKSYRIFSSGILKVKYKLKSIKAVLTRKSYF